MTAPPAACAGLRYAEWAVAFAGFMVTALLLARPLDPAPIAAIVTVGIGVIAVWIVWQDLRTFTIADGAVLALALLAFGARWSAMRLVDEPTLLMALTLTMDVLFTGGLLMAFREIYYRRRGFDGLGLGDVKLAAAGGLLVGAVAFAWALLAASLIGLVVVGARRLASRPLGASDKLAFGAVLAPAIWAVWAAQQTPLLLSLVER